VNAVENNQIDNVLFTDLQETPNTHLKIQTNEIIPDTHSPGWKSDAQKNIPGFRELYHTFPNAEWFIMLDDDSYIFLKNLDLFLSKFNSSEPYYFGEATSFVGEHFYQSNLFAQGGAGIIISKGAMKRLENEWDNCIEKYRDCWAGDVRISLCLRDVGVLVTHNDGFHSNSPNDNFDFTNHQCSIPFTFHHLLKHQIQSLYEVETLVQQGPILYQHVLSRLINTQPRNNTNRPGNDINAIHAENVQDCESKCKLNPKCVVFNYQDLCYLKSDISSLVVLGNSWSGIVVENYHCNGTENKTIK
jgi:hypothetical protein